MSEDNISAVIVCNGKFPRKEYPLYLISISSTIVCCDGAIKTFVHTFPNRMPDMVIGDMDSVSPKFLETYRGAVVVSDDQDTNDQTKAFNWLLANRSDLSTIYFVGATGKRADHTIANLSLLTDYAEKLMEAGLNTQIEMVDDNITAFPMLESGSFLCGKGRNVSIFSQDPTLRIASKGLVWPTDDVPLDKWWRATLNRAAEDEVSLTFNHPAPVIIVLS